MTRAWRLVCIATGTIVVAAAAALGGVSAPDVQLVLLGGGLVAGELLLLRPAKRSPLPLSFAVMTVLVRAASPAEFLVVVLVAELTSALVVVPTPRLRNTTAFWFERCCEAFAVGLAYRGVMAVANHDETLAVVLIALTAAAIAPIVVDDLLGCLQHRPIPSFAARSADVALVSSGILMGVSFDGVEGSGGLGIWGPVLFAIPLIAAWYSFELLDSTRRSFDQTIRALAAAPELGGLVRVGHADRVADLAVAMGRVLSLSSLECDQLDTAARLHHLGIVCLDEPAPGRTLDPAAVAAAGAEMLRASEALAPAGDVVAAEPLLHRPTAPQEHSDSALAGMILKVASAYDELTEGDDEHAQWAVEALYTGPGYVYDGRVLGALESVLERRELIPSR